MQEAVHHLTCLGLEKIGLQRVAITCLDDNHASAALAEKIGYKLETTAYGLLKNMRGQRLTLARRYVKFKEGSIISATC